MVQRTMRGSWAAVFTDNVAVQWTVLSGERRQCDGRRGGMQRCNRRGCWGRGGGAMDDRGECSSVFVFYLHMGMGEIHWREEVDPIVIIE